MVQTVQTLLCSQLACNEMQASAQTCRQTRSRQHDRKCRLKSSQVKTIYFHHPSQGNSTNYYLILGLRDKAAPPTSQQIHSKTTALEIVINQMEKVTVTSVRHGH